MFLPMARIALRGAPKLQLTKNHHACRATRFPFFPIDLLLKYGPDVIVKDRVWFFFFYARFCYVISAAAFIQWHQPYVGADYEHTWKSPRYLRRKASMEASGLMERNMKIKRTTFYLPDEIDNDIDPSEE